MHQSLPFREEGQFDGNQGAGSNGFISDTKLSALYDYWRSKGGGGFPARGDIEPTDIPKLLPYVILVDVLGPDLFRFRVVGTDVASGVDPTGKILGESAPEGAYRDHICELFSEAPRIGKPVHTVTDYGYRSGVEFAVHRLFLPLQGSESDIRQLLVGQVTDSKGFLRCSLWEEPPDDINVRVLQELPIG